MQCKLNISYIQEQAEAQSNLSLKTKFLLLQKWLEIRLQPSRISKFSLGRPLKHLPPTKRERQTPSRALPQIAPIAFMHAFGVRIIYFFLLTPLSILFFSHVFPRFVQRPILLFTDSCFRHPLFDLRGTRKVEIRHTNFHFSSKKVTSKSRKVEVFDLTNVKKLSTFRPKKAKVEKLKSRKVEKLKSRKVEKLKS